MNRIARFALPVIAVVCVVERNWMSAFDEEPGSMSYIMSKHQYLNDGAGNWYPHLMFHVPQADGANAGASWGANLPASPVVMDSAHKLWPEPQTIFFVPLSKWSDGTPGPPL